MKLIKTFEKFINDHTEEKNRHRWQSRNTDIETELMRDANNQQESNCEMPIQMELKYEVDMENIDSSKDEGVADMRPKDGAPQLMNTSIVIDDK